MRTLLLFGLMFLLGAPAAMAQVGQNERDRIQNAAEVIKQLEATPDDDIPQALWDRAECVGVIPSVKKGAFVVGAAYGKGLVSCRTKTRGWTAPAFYELEQGSWGLQIGAEETDLVFLVMNDKGMQHLIENRFTLGAGGSLAAGPVGRTANVATDVLLKAEVVSYSRARGVFAGLDLNGGVLKPDAAANIDAYGPNVTPWQILLAGTVAAPPVAEPFTAALEQKSTPSGSGLEP